MRLKLLLSIFFFCAVANAQTQTELKDFINENRSILKSIQKNMIIDKNTNDIVLYKELIKNQTASVKSYNTNKKEVCMYFAFLVRIDCLKFLKDHSQRIPENYNISELEEVWVKSNSESNKNILSETELKTIDIQNFLDSQSLNNLTLIVQ